MGPYVNALQAGLAHGLASNISIPRVLAALIPGQIQELLDVAPEYILLSFIALEVFM